MIEGNIGIGDVVELTMNRSPGYQEARLCDG